MQELNLKLPIEIMATENNGFIIKDSENSEFFFYKDKETGKLIYDGCCVEVKNKQIVFDHLKSE